MMAVMQACSAVAELADFVTVHCALCKHNLTSKSCFVFFFFLSVILVTVVAFVLILVGRDGCPARSVETRRVTVEWRNKKTMEMAGWNENKGEYE
jgi:hypothetical protein